MKNPRYLFTAVLAASVFFANANTPETGHGETASPGELSTGDDGTAPPCDNGGSEDGYCKECAEKGTSAATQASRQTAQGSNPDGTLFGYSGNGRRDVTDLEIAGSPGTLPLQFIRYSRTRLPSRNLGGGAFGREGSWSHSYE